jgi:Domain of unknown function (DUF4287)/Domain of unknown function (DUF5655)
MEQGTGRSPLTERQQNSQFTERQKKWVASVQTGVAEATGKSLEEWVEVARTCPETAHRARLKWFKDKHGLMQNRATWVLSVAFPQAVSWNDSDALRDALWKHPRSRAIFEAVKTAVEELPEVVAGQRKGYSAWSRKVQFAAVRPLRGGTAMLGLALPPETDARLHPPRHEGWSERLKSRASLVSPHEVDASLRALLKKAWSLS